MTQVNKKLMEVSQFKIIYSYIYSEIQSQIIYYIEFTKFDLSYESNLLKRYIEF